MQNHFPEVFAKSIIVLISAILDDLQVEKAEKIPIIIDWDTIAHSASSRPIT